ncbi:GTP-binding protein Rho1 [Coemansia sp. RSA 1813]|nr:GTP-binding protein Rho1 [Coemansia sp. RSA 1646]KAJ1772373.1 GTP-binding protein Rho1 [Coemansia sp. RSA 1843]KAJ2091098.1 GTP-binding protein Rho1 [Coemansia sp. RSA 986]KAJ2212132.1 GTP-binding protein Rho1 [Coemansia sp. RSA 487]KAJ2571179.1 GTP-binding protein Rho1 [Coemansia sp. RSA 1813]
MVTSSPAERAKPVSKRKVVVIGDGACGKTCLLHVFRDGDFPPDDQYIPTIFDTWVADMLVDDRRIELQLWDTAGQEELDRLRFLCYPDANVIIICYAVDSPDSLTNVYEKWFPEAMENAPRATILLVALKLDLRTDQGTVAELGRYGQSPVTHAEGVEVARKIHAVSYIECSSKQNFNVREVFEIAARWAIQPSNVQQSSSGCCSIL